MHRRDGRLDRVHAELARGDGSLHKRPTFLNLRPVPQRTILVLQEDQVALGRGAGFAARFLKEHQGKQAQRFREKFDGSDGQGGKPGKGGKGKNRRPGAQNQDQPPAPPPQTVSEVTL